MQIACTFRIRSEMPFETDNSVSDELAETQNQPSDAVNGEAGLADLRRILVESESVSEILPSAIRKSARRDQSLAAATLPIVEENIRQSAMRNPRVLAEAIFPIIGPAVRKAIAEALGQMVQSLNQTLDHSFSPEGVKWRLEAMRTGKPFAEVVLLHTLLYRVEQVFLIHKETGVMLQHVSVDPTAAEDGDMVSAMLTAIQDFVHDSFKESEDATLDALKVRDLSVWIEYGPDAILAAVIRGNAPLALRATLVEAIEEVELDFDEELENFRGDPSVFDPARPILERCLRLQLGESAAVSSRVLTPVNVLAAALLIVAIVAGFFVVRDYWRWSGFVTRLKHEPGFVVAEAERGFFTHSISGLRDDLAADPDAIRAEFKLDADDVVQDWRPFQAVVAPFVVERAKRLLSPPPTMSLSFSEGVLYGDGTASREWIAEARKLAPALNGVRSFEIGLSAARSAIESQHLSFVCGSTEFAGSDPTAMLTLHLEDLFRSAAAAGASVKVEIVGSADPTGTDDFNAYISRARAERVKKDVISQSEFLSSVGERLLAVGVGVENSGSECGARFRVIWEDK